jgi:beta-glucosidase-like glycosyl hydrolase
MSCAKHFPGHGDTAIDSHISLPVIAKSLKDLMKTDILPFQEAIKAGVSSIMLGHLSIPSIDSLPASLSRNVVTGLLRNKLGYEGIIMTDALTMNALDEFEAVPVQCLHAGVDILLHPANTDIVVQDIHKALIDGTLEEQQIDRAFTRVVSCKEKIKKKKTTVPHNTDHRNIASELFHAAITLVKADYTIFDQDWMNVDLFFTGDENRIDIAGIKEHVSGIHHIVECDESSAQQKVILAIFTIIAAWQGSSGISDEDRKRIKTVIARAKQSIVISFGSPYVLRYFTEADALIAAYDSSVQAQRAAMKCLKGDMQFQGTLPVSLNLS